MKIELPLKVNQIIKRLQFAGYEAYAVGGCIRDSILNRSPEDWDITTSATPYQVKELFDRTVDTGIQHGTVTIMLGKEGFEVTTYRVDGEYEDNRHPKQVEFTNQLVEDLRRRDFTINAMAYNETDGLVDAFGGLEDLRERRIKCVGCAKERFDEDALRILRAIRFSAQLDFTIEEDTLLAVKEKAQNLDHISAERIRDELNKLLLSNHPKKMLVLQATKITDVVLPELNEMLSCDQQNHHHIYTVGMHCLEAVSYFANKYPMRRQETDVYTKKEQLILRWTLLLHDVAKPCTKTIGKDLEGHFYGHAPKGADMAKKILQRLKFDNETIDYVYKLIYFHDYRYNLTMYDMRKAMNMIGTNYMEMLFEVQLADIMAQNPEYRPAKIENLKEAKKLYQKVMENGDCVNLKMLAVNGADLIQAGYEPGKKIGEKLNMLLQKVLEHPEWNTKEQLLKMI
ncbi:MAG: CCA tRNA nucleotidyltransferase [Clostridiales bacterium]|nr:CCA tRNA nucleotidyltransferase [Clostridiales bacterium]